MNLKFLKRNYLNRRSALVAGCAAAFMVPLYGCEQETTPDGTQRTEPATQQQPDQRDQSQQQQRQPGDQYQQQQDMQRERQPGSAEPDSDRTGTGTATGDDRTGARPGTTTTDDS